LVDFGWGIVPVHGWSFMIGSVFADVISFDALTDTL
jgi:hypothetical protein